MSAHHHHPGPGIDLGGTLWSIALGLAVALAVAAWMQPDPCVVDDILQPRGCDDGR